MAKAKSRTPMLDKMSEVRNECEIIGGFLECLGQQECEIASYNPVALRNEATQLAAALDKPSRIGHDLLVPVGLNIETILARYFQIDLNEAENERCELLSALRNRAA